MITREAIVEEARTYLGTKWRHQGRSRTGIDCVGLVVKIAHKFEVTDFDMTNYGRQATSFNFLKVFQEHADEISIKDVLDGDIIVFADGNNPCHAGLASTRYDTRYFIHASAARRVVMEERYDEEWRRKSVAFFRYRGL